MEIQTASPSEKATPRFYLTLDQLRGRTNQRNQDYYFTPFGTYVLTYAPDYPTELHIVDGYWDEDCWQQSRKWADVATLIGSYPDHREALRQMLTDLARRYRTIPLEVDPKLSPHIDGEEVTLPAITA